MTEKQYHYPFTAIVGQEMMKEAVILNLIDPSIGGVLIRGQKGTAKTTAVRAIPDLVKGMRVVELPVNATEDRVAGTLDFEQAIRSGEKKFEPGILSEANGHILYADEVNLLDDRIVDILLDAAASGVNTVERDGISYTHPSKFVLIGTMNPEEGNLRPQFLDRFGMVADVTAELDIQKRTEIIENRLSYERQPQAFCRKYARKQRELERAIISARALLPDVTVSKEMIKRTAEICVSYGTDGHRADIFMIKAASAEAAYHGRKQVTEDDLYRAALLVLPHRMRKSPLESGQMDRSQLEKLLANGEEATSSAEDG